MDITNSERYFDLLTLNPIAIQKITIILGIDDKTDIKHIERMSIWKNVDIVRCKGGHVVVKTLRNNGELYKILKSHIQ